MAKKKQRPKAKQSQGPSFEQSLQELEQIVRDLEEGKLGLNASLKRYEEGVQCLRQCHETLEHVEQKIELLTRINSDGSAQVERFANDESADLEEKRQKRSQRRSSERSVGDIDGPQGLF